jgi:hypothetical protein
MKCSNLKTLRWAMCCAATLVATAVLADEAANDTASQRTERELFKLSRIEAGDREVRVLTPAKPVSLVQPEALDDQPQEIVEPEATPMPSEYEDESEVTLGEDGTYDPTLLDDSSCESDCCEDLCCCKCLCGPPGNCWVRADILGWWTKGMHVPPLVTAGVSQAQPGIIGEPGTQILFGDGDILQRARVGGQLSAGAWLDDCHKWGVQGDYFGLQDLSTNYLATGLEYPFLSRPFIDVTNGLPGDPAVQAVSNEDLCGQVDVFAKTGFQGAGIDVRRNLHCQTNCCDPGGSNPCNWSDWSSHCCRLDFIGGFRFYRLDDSVKVRELLLVMADTGPIAQGTTFDIYDSFRTRNSFYGGDLGLIGTAYRGRWSLEVTAKVALGNNHSQVRIDGATTSTVPTQEPVTLPGGLLALPSNIGTYSRNDFVAIPQLSAQLGYQWNCHIRTFVGYNILYWANVARAGDQIDLQVDTNQLPPGSAGQFPEFNFNDTSFWAQGINGGLEYRW